MLAKIKESEPWTREKVLALKAMAKVNFNLIEEDMTTDK